MPDYSNYIGPVGNISSPGYSAYVDPESNVIYEVPQGTDVSKPAAPPKRSEVQQRADALRILNRTMGAAPEAPGPNDINPFLKFDLQSRDYIRRRQAVAQSEHEQGLYDRYNKGMANRERALNTIMTAQNDAGRNANEASKIQMLRNAQNANERKAADAEAKTRLAERKYEEDLKNEKDVRQQLKDQFMRNQEREQGLTQGSLTGKPMTNLTPAQLRVEMARQQQLAGGSLSGAGLIRRLQEELGSRYGLASDKGLEFEQTPVSNIIREVAGTNPAFAKQVLGQFESGPLSGMFPAKAPALGSEEEFVRSLLSQMSPEELNSLIQQGASNAGLMNRQLAPQFAPTRR